MSIQRSLILLVIFILAAAAINVPFATHFLKSRTDDKGRAIIMFHGPEAAVLAWPTATPHEKQWPAPTYWSEYRLFGYRRFHVQSADPSLSRHSMEFELIGWPLPVYEQLQMWWEWSNPEWQTDAQSDPALRLHWRGVLLNPLIFGGGLWLLLIAPLVAHVMIRKTIRRRRGRCLRCGYDLRGDFERGCSECGWNRTEDRGEDHRAQVKSE